MAAVLISKASIEPKNLGLSVEAGWESGGFWELRVHSTGTAGGS